MTAFSTVIETEIHSTYLGSAVEIALTSDVPSESGGTELAGNGYVRQTVTFPTATGSPRSTSNSVEILFPVATGADWAQIVGVEVREVSTDRLLFKGPLDAPVSIALGEQFRFAPGDLTIVID